VSDYHQHPAISKTGMGCFRSEGRRVYHGRHVLRLPEAQLTPTPGMNLGTLCHAELLEPGSLEGQYAIRPEEWKDWKTKAAQNWRKEHQEAGHIVVAPADIAASKAMVLATMAAVKPWFTSDAIIEQPLFWTDSNTGLDCRCKPDWLVVRPKLAICFDFKTTDDASPTAFVKRANQLEYWIQDQHYRDGVRAEYDVPCCDFYFVAVESSWPYRVSINRIEPMADEYRDTLRVMHGCYETDDWSEPWEGQIHDVKIWRKQKTVDPMQAF